MGAPNGKWWIELPEFRLPEGFATDFDCLKCLVMEGAWNRWGARRSADVDRRLAYELEMIGKGCPRYLLIVHDYLKFARTVSDVETDFGPQCASAVLYALGIVSGDPVARGLRFEVFLNPLYAETWIPEIKIKIRADARQRVFAYLRETYGRDHVARVGGISDGVVLAQPRIGDVTPLRTLGSDELPVTAGDVLDIVMSKLVMFEIGVLDVHPMLQECLRQTNRTLVYQEQLIELLHTMSGASYPWAADVCNHLVSRRLQNLNLDGQAFVKGCLENRMFRVGSWKDEESARRLAESLWDDWRQQGPHLALYAHVVSGSKEVRCVTSRTVVGEVSIVDIARALKRGERVAILIRHAERPPLEKNDPTFGADLPITEDGKAKADALGFALFEYCRGYGSCIYAGESRRCRMTAAAFAAHDGSGTVAYIRKKFLGGGSPYFADVGERMALANEGDYPDSLNAYFRTGRQRGFKDLASATDAFEHELWNAHLCPRESQLGVFVTHDLNVACFLAGRRVVAQFDENNWPHYLDAAVAFLGPNGHARYGVMRCYDNKLRINL